MNIDKHVKVCLLMTTLAFSACLSSCGVNSGPVVVTAAPDLEPQDAAENPDIAPMSPDGPLFPDLTDVEEEDPIPDYLRVGTEHPIVAALQERLMELGFMDNDEPTEYYGEVTANAVKHFQRQNGLAEDGVIGQDTLMAILSPDAKYYAVSKGVKGDDIQQIQGRLYELGYLASADQVTGYFGDSTEQAVLKLQQMNGLKEDGKVGRQTMNLLYSDEIKPNMLEYGEKSEVVLACQERLRDLGYMTSEPDGTYGNDTTIAVRRFQSRNDLVVDGYLGPSTRVALDSPSAVPNGLSLGDEDATVKRVQELLNKYGYLVAGNVTGYYGEITENAVKSFQRQNGLTADGMVGVQTMSKLTGDNVRRAPANSGGSSSGGSSGSSSSGRGSSGGSSSGGGSSSSSGGSSGGGGAVISDSSGVSRLISVARSKIGSPYVWGAKGPNSFDCSGFVYWCLNQSGVKQSYLTSSGWRSVGRYQKITSFGDLRAGDIVVVSGHVGICSGSGSVIDASSSHGRVVERSLSSWWRSNFICGWRIFG
ncbi:MAG TPA: peptidoglycan-binding protein [Candidatus Lachnoclostridium stercoripullorum]|uniref:Peptidoglycan-binding protein n=1 Tax=Candidatus Lachnoclostridium stercoripullorum TaxID=2838635 RepID=A0A9D2AVT3_9FIRM|nr:peptidoglycan-binding protein [Candidatus Lachnoclostridium stercoripullorum]